MQALWMALGALFFSIMGVCIKLASPHYGTMEILFYRGLTGVVIFSILMRLQRVPHATPVLGLHVRRSLSGVTAMALWFYAIAHLPFASAICAKISGPGVVGPEHNERTAPAKGAESKS